MSLSDRPRNRVKWSWPGGAQSFSFCCASADSSPALITSTLVAFWRLLRISVVSGLLRSCRSLQLTASAIVVFLSVLRSVVPCDRGIVVMGLCSCRDRLAVLVFDQLCIPELALDRACEHDRVG